MKRMIATVLGRNTEKIAGRWTKVLVVPVMGVALLFAGCAETMMGDKAMMKEKEMTKEQEMKKKEMMKEEKETMEKK